jgi:hypothetical protein
MNRWYKSVQEWFWEIFKWVLGHDCYGAQNQTKSWAHQLCWAHLKRDLKYCVEEGMWFGHISFKILRLLYRSRKAQKRLIDGSIKMIYKEKIRWYYEKKMRELCLLCESATWKIRKIAKRIIKHMDKMFVFLEKLFVPWHNNGSERWLRMQKIHEKVSWWFRILDGAKNYCKILSVIESLKKQGKNVIDSLYQIYINSFSRSLGSE